MSIRIRSFNLILKIITILLLFIIPYTSSFYTQLVPGQQNKCYMITTFPNENILIHLRLPIIAEKIKIQVQCFVKGKLIFNKQVRKVDDKITVSLDNSAAPGNLQQTQTCIKTTILQNNPQNQQIIRDIRLLVWFSQTANFIKTIQNSQKSRQAQLDDEQMRQNYMMQIKRKILNMNATYEQQLNMFYINKKTDEQNQKYLQQILNSIYSVTIIETAVIFLSIFIYVYVIYKNI